MKKISLFLVAMLALTVAFVGCKKGDDATAGMAAMTEKDIENTDWLIGTWNVTTTTKIDMDIDGEGITDSMKQMIKESMSSAEEGVYEDSVTITKADAKEFATDFKGYIKAAEESPKEVTYMGTKSKVSTVLKINAEKTKIIYNVDTESSSSYAGMKVASTVSVKTVYEKQ